MRKTYFKAKTTEFPASDERFMKTEYVLNENNPSFVLVCYTGDCTIGESVRHGNSIRNKRPLIRNAPIVKPKITSEMVSSAPPKAVYDKLTSTYCSPFSPF